VDRLTYELNTEEAQPVFKTVPGWFTSLSEVGEYDQFPQQLKDYVKFLEEELGVPIKMVSVGPDRKQTILR
jgi:adenylosuccinate synthase